ncbi:hypothetical protein ACFL5V_08255 [Fibrobacterota bacterium]
MDLADLFTGPVPWLKERITPEEPGTRTICSAFRFYRNLSFYPFLPALSQSQKREIKSKLLNLFNTNDQQLCVSLDKCSTRERTMLAERFLLPRDRTISEKPKREENGLQDACVVITNSSIDSALINMGEHLTYSHYSAGFSDIKSGKEAIKKILSHLSRETWACDTQYGYLNADPAKAGSGFRISALIHFPAIQLMRQQEQMMKALKAIGLIGSGTGDLTGKGGLTWISSRRSLGLSEEGVFMDFHEKLKKCMKLEEELSESFIKGEKYKAEDKVFRAFHVLLSARILTFYEFLNLSSWVRLGVYFHLLRPELLRLLNYLLVKSSPEHIQLAERSPLSPEERDVKRAAMVRQVLKEYEN